MQDWRDQAGIGAMCLSESFIAPLVPWGHLLSHELSLGCGIKTESDRSLLASIKKFGVQETRLPGLDGP